MQKISVILMVLFSLLVFNFEAFAAQKKKTQNRKISAVKIKKKYKGKGTYKKKKKSGLDLVQLTTKSPFDDEEKSPPTNGVNPIETSAD